MPDDGRPLDMLENRMRIGPDLLKTLPVVRAQNNRRSPALRHSPAAPGRNPCGNRLEQSNHTAKIMEITKTEHTTSKRFLWLNFQNTHDQLLSSEASVFWPYGVRNSRLAHSNDRVCNANDVGRDGDTHDGGNGSDGAALSSIR